VVGKSSGYWLSADDFIASEEVSADESELARLGFPRDWPAVYSSNSALKSLIGKRGRIPSKRAAVAGVPTAEQRAKVAAGFAAHPLQSFANAERAAETLAGVKVVQGWAVFERLDRPPGAAFVAERYWWNALPDGTWVDLTPRPEAWENLLLAEAAQGAPKRRSVLTAAEAAFAARLLDFRFEAAARKAASPSPAPAPAAAGGVTSRPKDVTPATSSSARPRPTKEQEKPHEAVSKPAVAPPATQAAAKPLDYSRWSCIVDSDDEVDEAAAGKERMVPQQLFGVKDLADGKDSRRQPPVPDYLLGNSSGGGGMNCYTSLCRLLDADANHEKASENTYRLAQAFGKIFHCGLKDEKRQRFYKDAIAAGPEGAFIVILGLGSILPALEAARRAGGRVVLLEQSARLANLAREVAKANGVSLPTVAIKEGFAKKEPLTEALRQNLPEKVKHVVIITELFSPDLLSSGIVPSCTTAHAAVTAIAPKAKVHHIPKTVELSVTPMELRSERIGEFDIRPFNAFRHSSSNDKADFWWWATRLDNQPDTKVGLLGPSQTLAGFDFDRSSEIPLDEVRRDMQLKISQRGRLNAVALWWTARTSSGLEYSTKPGIAGGDPPSRSEWKQAVHYLAGETSVFVGDSVEVKVSLTPCFTVRMMQISPFSVEAPVWVKAPQQAKASATLPILPYHFLMMTDVHRLQVYADAIRAAVRQQRKRLGRRPRVLDAGCGLGLLGMTAALEGADVWLCEAVPQMRQMCREVLAVNAKDIAEKQGLVYLLPAMMSTRLQVGEGDVTEKFDVIVSEVLDVWGLGEGVIPTMRHAHKKLLAKGGEMLPSRLVIFAQPLELQKWSQAERDSQVNLSPLGETFTCQFEPARIRQFPHRMLSDEPQPVLEIDLRNIPEQPADGAQNVEGVELCIRMGAKPALHAKMTQMRICNSGMLCGYGMWWAADLGNGHVISNSPSSPQRSWKQIIRWLDEPRFVGEGEDVQVLASYNEQQVHVKDLAIPQEMFNQYREQIRAEHEKEQQHQQQQQQQQKDAQQKVNDAAVAAALGAARATATAQSQNVQEYDDVIEVD